MNPENDINITNELLDGLIRKVRDLESSVAQLPNHKADFEQLAEHIKELKASYQQNDKQHPAEQIQKQLDELQEKIKTIPEIIPVRHHFDLRSKGFIIGGSILLITVAMSVGVAISTTIKYTHVNTNADKFRMVRQSFPDAAKWADTTYHASPEAAMKLTDSLEAISATLAAEEREAEELNREQKAKQNKVKALRKIKQQRIREHK
jgi:hypothetical protein